MPRREKITQIINAIRGVSFENQAALTTILPEREVIKAGGCKVVLACQQPLDESSEDLKSRLGADARASTQMPIAIGHRLLHVIGERMLPLPSKLVIIACCLLTLFGCRKHSKHLQKFLTQETYSYQHSSYPQDVEEINTPIELTITGQVPEWLQGKLFRNGPGKFSVGNQHLTHWFDGFALIASFEFEKGKVYYQTTFLKSDQFLESMESKTLKLSGFGQNFGESKAKHRSGDGQPVKTANANINIESIGQHLIALGETPLPIEFEPATLQTIRFFDYDDSLKKARTWESAHMKRDPSDGSLYNFYIDYGRKSAYMIYKIEAGKTSRELLARYEIDEPSYMHDFSITKNYIILTAYPLVVNPIDLLGVRYSFMGAHRWEPERKTSVYIFDKKTGKLVKALKTQPMFAFHHINAFEDPHNLIHIYLSAADNPEIILKLGALREYENKFSNLQLRKIVIDLKKSSIDIIPLSNDSYEMPRIQESLVGKENQYFYAIWYNPPTLKSGFGLVKYDLKNNQTAASWLHEGLLPGEPLFVSNPVAATEDEGVILSIMYDNPRQESFLVIIDARSMQELARAQLPQSLPVGLHGKFISAAF